MGDEDQVELNDIKRALLQGQLERQLNNLGELIDEYYFNFGCASGKCSINSDLKALRSRVSDIEQEYLDRRAVGREKRRPQLEVIRDALAKAEGYSDELNRVFMQNKVKESLSFYKVESKDASDDEDKRSSVPKEKINDFGLFGMLGGMCGAVLGMMVAAIIGASIYGGAEFLFMAGSITFLTFIGVGILAGVVLGLSIGILVHRYVSTHNHVDLAPKSGLRVSSTSAMGFKKFGNDNGVGVKGAHPDGVVPLTTGCRERVAARRV